MLINERVKTVSGYTLSIGTGTHHYCTEGETAELALYDGEEWAAPLAGNFPDALAEFVGLWEETAYGVAPHVPLETVAAIISALGGRSA